MLIEFSVKNWRSIKDEQKLSMVMAKSDELAASNTFDPAVPATGSLLRSAAIYGPNAAGKSNIIRALRIMQKIVVESASEGQLGDAIKVVPFLLDAETEKMPSEFEVIFVADGVRYQYGFAATSERIVGEWLLAYPHGSPQRWLEREWDSTKETYKWGSSNALSGQKKLWQESTRENALFLSTAVQLNSKQLTPVFDWFKRNLRVTNITGWSPMYTASLCKDEVSRVKILEFVKAADLDIQSIEVKSENISEHLPKDFPEELKKKLLADMKDEEFFEIKTIHLSAQGQPVKFEFKEESDGTKKYFAFAGPWLNALDNGYTLVIDELHDNLHPKMVQFLVELFHNNATNPKNAQLIFTTHETSILSQAVFRRDQIWFCEKNDAQATQLYPLTDFSPRKGREDLEANYLAGRYGALPYIREIKTKKAL
jgi:uncharacterized protein